MEHDFVINDRIFVRSFVKGKNIRLLMFSIRFTTSADRQNITRLEFTMHVQNAPYRE